MRELDGWWSGTASIHCDQERRGQSHLVTEVCEQLMNSKLVTVLAAACSSDGLDFYGKAASQ